MKNEKLVEELLEIKQRATKNENKEVLTNFKLGDLKVEVLNEKDRKISLNGVRVEGRGLRTLSDRLKVKPQFFDLSKKIGEQEFEEINSRLRNSEAETPIFATLSTNSKEESVIRDLYFTRPELKSIIKPSNYFDMLIESLKECEVEYKLEFYKQEENTSYVELSQVGRELLVLPDDPWKSGSAVSFSSTDFNIHPYFLRRVCTNGMTTHENAFGAKLNNKKYNELKIQNMITEKLNANFDILEQEIKNQVEKFSKNNLSVAEFRRLRDKVLSTFSFSGNKTTEEAVSLTNKFFPDNHLFEAYKCNYTQKSEQWLRTADAGINAYDAFNKVTWMASHPKMSHVTPGESADLMIEASNLLFKRDGLDMSNIAPKVTFHNN